MARRAIVQKAATAARIAATPISEVAAGRRIAVLVISENVVPRLQMRGMLVRSCRATSVGGEIVIIMASTIAYYQAKWRISERNHNRNRPYAVSSS